MVVMGFFQRHPEIRRRQHGENERLEEGHQKFERHHEQRERNSRQHTRDRAADAGARFSEYKDQADETQDHNVTGCDVGKKTQQQGEGAEEQAEYLNRGEDEDFQHRRNARHPERVLPKMFVAAEQHDHKRDERQHDRDRNIARHVGAARKEGDLSDQVKAEDKKEHRQEKRHVFFIFRADGRSRHVVSDKGVKGLEEVLQTFRRLSFAPHGRGGCHAEQEEQQQRGQDHREHVAGDGIVVKTRNAASHDTAVEGGFGVEFLAFAVDEGGVNGLRFAVFFDLFVGITFNIVFAGSESGVFDAHHVAVYEHVTFFTDLAVAVVVRMKGGSGGQRPAMSGRIQNAGEVQVKVAENMDSIRVGDVVNGGFAGVEFAFFYFINRVTAVAMRAAGSSCRLGMVGLVRLFVLVASLLRMVFVVVLRKSRETQTAENQGNPVFANGCHIHFWKGFFQIGCKSTTRFSLKKTGKIIFPKKIGRAGYLRERFGI